jgi:hypothetical protein
MNRTEAMSWVLSVCAHTLRLSQSKTLSVLVSAALSIHRVTVSQIGRLIQSVATCKSRIKQAERFIANRRIEISDGMRGVVAKLLHCQGRKKLLIALDWTEIRDFHCLAACAVIRGRGVPLLWASYKEWDFHHSQNSLEEGLLRLLRDMIPPSIRVILLADRGFGRTELARLCQELKFHYVIRTKSDVYIRGRQFTGKLMDLPVRKGDAHLLLDVEYRKENPVRQNLVVAWKRNLPAKRDEPWFLMTDLNADPWDLTRLYARRMTIEECFRDQKSKRNGFALRLIQVTMPDRIDRLLLILVLAYLLLIGLGLIARQRYRPSEWCNTNNPRQCSNFTIGRHMLERMTVSPADAVAAIIDALTQEAQNWG